MTGAELLAPQSLLILPEDLSADRVRLFRLNQSETPLLEDPLFSNHAPWLDALCDRWQVPRGSYWCAGLKADQHQRLGLWYPPIDSKRDRHPWKCETWRVEAIETGRFFGDWSRLRVGDGVLYSATGRAPATHISTCVAGIVRDKRGKTYAWDFQGNTSGDPTFSRNGELSDIKPVLPERVIGFISLDPVSA